MIKKIFNTFIVALMLALSLFLAAAVKAGNFAYAEDALSVEDDFDKTEGKLDENLNAYALTAATLQEAPISLTTVTELSRQKAGEEKWKSARATSFII